jgi:hypothetical protein
MNPHKSSEHPEGDRRDRGEGVVGEATPARALSYSRPNLLLISRRKLHRSSSNSGELCAPRFFAKPLSDNPLSQSIHVHPAADMHGQQTYTVRFTDGSTNGGNGEFVEIDAPRKIVMTRRFEKHPLQFNQTPPVTLVERRTALRLGGPSVSVENTTVVLQHCILRSARHKRFLMQLVAVLALSPAVWAQEKPAVEDQTGDLQKATQNPVASSSASRCRDRRTPGTRAPPEARVRFRSSMTHDSGTLCHPPAPSYEPLGFWLFCSAERNARGVTIGGCDRLSPVR